MPAIRKSVASFREIFRMNFTGYVNGNITFNFFFRRIKQCYFCHLKLVPCINSSLILRLKVMYDPKFKVNSNQNCMNYVYLFPNISIFNSLLHLRMHLDVNKNILETLYRTIFHSIIIGTFCS